jgi:general secretion pathway protein C
VTTLEIGDMMKTGLNWSRLRTAGGVFGRRRGSRQRPSGRGVGLTEIVLVALIGLVAGRILVTALAPLPVAENPPPPQRAASPAQSGAADINPFRTATPAVAAVDNEAPDAVETSLDLTLHGTWNENEDAGSAIIRTPDGEQSVFLVGEEICCGAALVSVHSDRIIISRGGTREALYLAGREPGARAARAPRRASEKAAATGERAPARMPSDGAGIASLFDGVARVNPSVDESGLMRFRLFPGEDETAFEAMGLRSGDVLVSINNRPAPTNMADLGAALSELRTSGRAEVVVERAGARVPLSISVGPAPPKMQQ